MDLGPSQPLFQWVPGLLSQVVGRLVHEVDRSPLSDVEVKMSGAISPIPNTLFLPCTETTLYMLH
jgi:hypothetical protein